METIQKQLAANPKYINLLGEVQAIKLLKLFAEIENGKYDKNEYYVFHLKGIQYPLYIRAIRADMQSFINTFISPYLEKQPYMNEVRTVIDAGANIGYTAILFANWWPGCKIISIEPDVENYEFTIKNTALYRNITVLNNALWNKRATLKIEAGQEDGFVVRELKGNGEVLPENITMGIPVDDILLEHKLQQIDFLKMNIEGGEKEIFEGDFHTWLPKVNHLLVELHDGKNPGSSKAVFSATSQYAFAVAETAPYGILFSKENAYREWYRKWYKESIYEPNINKDRFPDFYLDK